MNIFERMWFKQISNMARMGSPAINLDARMAFMASLTDGRGFRRPENTKNEPSTVFQDHTKSMRAFYLRQCAKNPSKARGHRIYG